MRRLLFLLSLVCVFSSQAQINSTEIARLLANGDSRFKEGDYIEAINSYKEVMATNPTNMKAQYQLGESHRMILDYESAEYYYEMIGSDQDIRYPLAGYYHALMQKLKGKYEVALRNFKEFRKFMVVNELHETDKYRNYYKQARVEIDGCQMAINQMTMFHPDRGFIAVGQPANSEFNDWAAFTIGSDDILCLTSGRSNKGSALESQFGEAFADLFRFKKNGDRWEEYEPKDRFESVINTKSGDGSGSFNRERTKFYYTSCDQDLGICHIYLSRLEGGKWSDPSPLNLNINDPEFSSKHPNLTPGGDTLFFASDREGGMGKLDLYMSLNAGGDNWGPAIHLGPEINTPENELSPMFDNIEQVLFFASDGHRGFGGYDIYVARGSKFENAEIYNAGSPFNTYKNDLFFFIGDRKGFLTSDREEGPGKFDIYEFTVKSRSEIISELSGEGTIAGRNSLFTDDYNFDSGETEIINQIISRRLSSSVSDIELILSERQLAVYNSLSDDDRERIDRIVNARFKKMTDNMIQSIRTEDDYYYQQLSVEKRRKVDNMVASYLEQQGLGNSVNLSDELFGFYSSVGNDEREKIDVLISDKLKSAQSFVAATPTYSKFSEKEQLSLDGITMKYLKEKKNLDDIPLSMNEKVFLRDNQDKVNGDVSEAVRERIIGLSNEEKYQLLKSDRDFYESLSDDDKARLRSMAETFMVSDLSNFTENVKASDLDVFKDKSSQDQAKLDKLLLKQISNLANSSIYLTETTFSQEELQASLGESSDETIRKLLELRPGLSDAQKSAVKRFVKTAYDSYMTSAEPVFQKEIPTVIAGSTKLVGDPSAKLSAADVDQYNNLSAAKKRAIDNSIGLDYIVSEYSERTTRLQDEYKLSEITNKEKVHIAVLAKKISGQEIKPAEEGFLRDAFTYYNNLSQDRKAFINRVVLDSGLPTRNGKYVLPSADASARSQLSESEKSLLATLKKFRFNNDRILTENLALDAKDVTPEPIDIVALAAKSKVEEENTKVLMKTEDILASEELDEIKIGLPIDKIDGYDEITIRGKLVGSNSGDPLSSFAITLIQFDNTSTVIEGYTDKDGYFEFVVAPAKYDLTFKKANSSESVIMEDFNVEGKRERDASVVVNATRAFFDVSSSQLRPEVKILLDEVYEAYRSTGKKIEIESHTDDTGTVEFNLVLSKDRGYAARDYLIEKGVGKSKISVIWHGSEKPIADNSNPFGRQLNRRIDVRLLGKRKISFGNFFLVRPGTTVSKVSASMQIGPDEIRALNGLGTSDFSSYQPIRLKPSTEVEPDYNLLVPADIKSGSDLVYTVRVGDNLQTVARKFNVPEELIMEQNGLTSSRLEPGTRLIIYPKN